MCVCINISKTIYILHCGMKSQRLLLAIQSVPFLSMLSPAGACSSLSDCPAQRVALADPGDNELQQKLTPCPCRDQVPEFGGWFACSSIVSLTEVTIGM